VAAAIAALFLTGEFLGMLAVAPVLLILGAPILGAPILGALVTAASLWRRWGLPAAVWLLCWAFIAGFFWLAAQNSATGEDLGTGLLGAMAIMELLAVSLGSSALALIATQLLTWGALGHQAEGQYN